MPRAETRRLKLRTHGQIKPDYRKLRELILYLAVKCREDETFGAVKLNKLLYFCDFYHYAVTGKPITGVQYMKLPHGPAPKRLVPIRDDMVHKQELFVQATDYHAYRQRRPIALRDPDLSAFSGEEIAFVDRVIEHFCFRTGREVTALSHLETGWEVVEERDVIPYESVLVSAAPPSERAIKRGRELAREHGLVSETS